MANCELYHVDEYVCDISTLNGALSYTSNSFSKPIVEMSLQALFVHLWSPLPSLMHVILIMWSLHFLAFIHERLQTSVLYKLEESTDRQVCL